MAKFNIKQSKTDQVKAKLKKIIGVRDIIPQSKWDEMNLQLMKQKRKIRIYQISLIIAVLINIYLLTS